MKTNQAAERHSKDKWYDFSGPLWEDYWNRTRKTVKFPRGYKEVSSI